MQQFIVAAYSVSAGAVLTSNDRVYHTGSLQSCIDTIGDLARRYKSYAPVESVEVFGAGLTRTLVVHYQSGYTEIYRVDIP